MSTEANKKLVQQVYADSANRSGTTFVDNLADDASWIVTGQYSWSHEFKGKDAILDGLMGHFRSHFAVPRLEVANWRWSGTRFILRTGKAMAARRKQAVVRFRAVPHLPFSAGAREPVRNELRIGLDGPYDLTLALTGTAFPVDLTAGCAFRDVACTVGAVETAAVAATMAPPLPAEVARTAVCCPERGYARPQQRRRGRREHDHVVVVEDARGGAPASPDLLAGCRVPL